LLFIYKKEENGGKNVKKEIRKIDISFVKRYQKNPNDLEAFNEIYNFYRDYLLYFAFTYTKDMNDAEEVVQETFVKVIHKIHTLEKAEAFHAWLYRICYTTAMLQYRTNNKYDQFKDENDDENIEDLRANTNKEYTKNRLYEEVNQVISELGVRYQPVAQLYYFDELKIKEISEVLEIPEGTIKSRLNKIRSDLKNRLEEHGLRPGSLLSVGFTPFMYQYFQEIMKTVQMDPSHTSVMLDGLHNTITSIGTTALATKSIHSITKQKVLTSLGIAIVGTLALYYFLPKDPITIEQVSYYQEITNKTLEVDVLLNTAVLKEDITITNEKQKIPFIHTEATISFEVEKNGTYTFKVGDQIKDITITNIDKEAPVMKSSSYINTGIQLEIYDNYSIDYEKSYALYQDTKYPITKTNTIIGDFKDATTKVYLYDTTGNMSVYELISEVVEQ
jgi:RNA polymerase sigma-70 factor (ECF subfamily)